MLNQSIHDPVLLTDPVNRQHPLAQGLVAWWLTVPGLDGGSKWYDLMGLNHGTLTNMAASTSGWGKTTTPGGWGCLEFDGVNDYVNVLNTANLGVSSTYTLSAWMKPTTLSSYRPIIFRGSGQSNDIELYIQTPSRMVLYHNRGNGGVAAGGGFTFTNANVWSHVTCTFAFGVGWKAYINGVETTFTVDAGSGQAPNVVNTRWQLGQTEHSDFAGVKNFIGALDDIRIYDRALPAAHVAELYRQSLSGYPGVLTRFTVQSLIGGSQDIVAQGGATAGGSAATWVVGSFSSAGGSLVDGASQSAVTYLPTPSGSAIVNGAGQLNTAYQPVIAGGCGAGGTAFQIFADTVEVAGGCATSGTSSPTVAYTMPTSGGAGGSGSAQLGIGVTASGGSWIGGSGVTSIIFQSIAQGGVGGAGQAFNFSTFNEQATNGARSGGSASSNTFIFQSVAQGGVQAAGNAFGFSTFSEARSGGASSGGSTVATLLIQSIAQGGVRGAGQASIFSTFSERATNGASAAGVAFYGSVVSPVVAGGIQLNGSARLTFNDTFEVSGGAIANGTSHAGASYFFSSTGGAVVRGYALQLIGVSNPTRITYHRFRIGDLVYVPSPIGDRYLRAAIQSIYSYNELDYYEVGLGWFPDRMLLSFQQYRAWLRRRR